MASGPEHYREAEQLLAAFATTMSAVNARLVEKRTGANAGERQAIGLAKLLLDQAQVHATLAQAAATAYPAILAYTGDELGAESRAWTNVTAPSPQQVAS
jgi:hypothetical protein